MAIKVNMSVVAARAVAECERQHVGIERLCTLLTAHSWLIEQDMSAAKFHALHPEDALTFIKRLAGMVEPDNGGKFRSTPVTFANGGTAVPAGEVEQAMRSLVTHGSMLTADEWVRECLDIHFAVDGNGRTAYLMHALLSDTLGNPEPLPKFFDGE